MRHPCQNEGTSATSIRAASIGAALALSFALAAPSQCQQLARSVRVTEENDGLDFWLPPDRRSDDNYTQGARIGWDVTGVPGVARPLICRQRRACGTSLEVGQEMYTPTFDSSLPIRGQRSYAGWLYTKADVIAATASSRRDVAVTIGVTGQASLSEETQVWFHHLTAPSRTPLGWKYQLPTEPDMAMQFEQAWYLAPFGAGARWTDVVPESHATLGTLRTAAGAGGRLRAGFDLDHPWLVNAAPSTFTVFAFVGGDGEAVERDLFLDGNTFRPSLRRDHKPFVTNWERGIDLRIAHLGLEYRAVTQSREYRAGPAAHTFAGITVAWWTAR